MATEVSAVASGVAALGVDRDGDEGLLTDPFRAPWSAGVVGEAEPAEAEATARGASDGAVPDPAPPAAGAEASGALIGAPTGSRIGAAPPVAPPIDKGKPPPKARLTTSRIRARSIAAPARGETSELSGVRSRA